MGLRFGVLRTGIYANWLRDGPLQWKARKPSLQLHGLLHFIGKESTGIEGKGGCTCLNLSGFYQGRET